MPHYCMANFELEDHGRFNPSLTSFLPIVKAYSKGDND